MKNLKNNSRLKKFSGLLQILFLLTFIFAQFPINSNFVSADTPEITIVDKPIGQLVNQADGLIVNWEKDYSASNYNKQVFYLTVQQDSSGTSSRTIDPKLYLNELNFNVNSLGVSNLKVYKVDEQWTNQYYPKTCTTTSWDYCHWTVVNGTGSWNYPDCTVENGWGTKTTTVTDAAVCGTGVNYVIQESLNQMPVSESMFLYKFAQYQTSGLTENTAVIDLNDMVIPAYDISNKIARTKLKIVLEGLQPTILPTGGKSSSGTFSVNINGNEFWDKTHSSWWNDTYLYKEKYDITSNNGNIIYINLSHSENMQDDFDDVRFVHTNEAEKFNYFLLNKSDGKWAEFYVRTLGNTSFYIYYGNSIITTEGNFENVFSDSSELFYKLDETSGTSVTDSSGNGRTGTNTGATVGATGKIGTAYDFEATESDKLNSSLSITGYSQFAMSLWVKPESFTSRGQIVSEDVSSSNRPLYIEVNQNANPTTTFSFVLNGTGFGMGNLSIGTWSHLFATYNGTHLKLVNNGKIITDYTRVNRSLTSGSTLQLGWRVYSSYPDYYDGIIDHFQLFGTNINFTNPSFSISEEEERVSTVVNLINPANNSYYNLTNIVIFGCNASIDTSLYGITNLTLYINNSPQYSVQNITSNSNLTMNYSKTLTNSFYNWSCKAKDSLGNEISSETRILTMNATNSILNTTVTNAQRIKFNDGTNYGRLSTGVSTGTNRTETLNIVNPTEDKIIMISHTNLNGALKIYVNDNIVGTITADAAGEGEWIATSFNVSNTYITGTNDVIKIQAPSSNSAVPYIDNIYIIERNVISSQKYMRENQTIAFLSDVTLTGLNYSDYYINYSNGTNYVETDTALFDEFAIGESLGELIYIFNYDDTAFDGSANITLRYNSTYVSELGSSVNQSLILDSVDPDFETITTTLTNVLQGRAYNITLNETETNPSYVEFYMDNVLKFNLTHNITEGFEALWYNYSGIIYEHSNYTNLKLISYDLAGNSYSYNFDVGVSNATYFDRTLQLTTAYNRNESLGRYLNVTSTDVSHNLNFSKNITIDTEGASTIADYIVRTNITDPSPKNFILKYGDDSINSTILANDTRELSWTTDTWTNNASVGTFYLNFNNTVSWTNLNAIKVKYSNVGVQNERLVWINSSNTNNNITDLWLKIPLRTAYTSSTNSVALKKCLTGYTYGGTTCDNWVVETATYYLQTDTSYHDGINYPTEDDNNDGSVDTAWIKLSNVQPNSTTMFSFDVVAVAETAWTTPSSPDNSTDGAGGGGGGASGEDDDEDDTDLIDSNLNDGSSIGKTAGNAFKFIGDTLNDYLVDPISNLISKVSTKWNDTTGFFVVSGLVLLSGAFLFLSGGNSRKMKRRGFNL